MPLYTLWESICLLAGKDGLAEVQLSEAVAKSAVPDIVAKVEIRQMIEDGLITGTKEVAQLTERGREACASINRIAGNDETIAPE